MNYWTIKELAFEVKRSVATVRRWMTALGIDGGGCAGGCLLYSETKRQRFLNAVETRTITLLKRPVPVRLKNGVSTSGRGQAARREGPKVSRRKGLKKGGNQAQLRHD